MAILFWGKFSITVTDSTCRLFQNHLLLSTLNCSEMPPVSEKQVSELQRGSGHLPPLEAPVGIER